MLWPVVGSVVVRTETPAILRGVLRGGLHDRAALDADLVAELSRCGSLPGHPHAFRSLCREWRSWIAARADYAKIPTPVTLVYGERDWSHPDERAANVAAIPAARLITLTGCGHFASLEQPDTIARLIAEEVAG
jgi:pimeloyl-ACP methyl ester carboxylesterase